jgi:hypothetical protein
MSQLSRSSAGDPPRNAGAMTLHDIVMIAN